MGSDLWVKYMVVQHNLTSMFTQRQLGVTTSVKHKSSEKLSSGYRINRAADDAAGLAISEKMRRLIRGMGQNLDNIQDGISFCQVADGYLFEVHDMIQRINELGVQAANETLSDEDRQYVDSEVQQIKDEMQRIFDGATFNEMAIFRVPYSPSVVPHDEPYDTQVFYSGSGQIGGLEFNNVRYNISELTSKGMKLDSNGVATADQEVEFDLWDGEHVKLKLDEGQSLASVRREYDWKADNTGILVNNVRAATWQELGVAGDGHDAGQYTFDYHGMSVSFTIPDGDKLTTIMNGINGDGITKPSYWDSSVASITTRPVIKYNSNVTLQATNSNASYFDHKYEISANTSGMAVTDVTDGTGSSAITNWSEFRNVGGVIPSDTTNSGYPIVDWGIDNDGNDSSQITFDTEALYRYTGKNSNLPVQFTFNLADVSSQQQVISAVDGTKLSGAITCPASLSYRGSSAGTSTTDGSSFRISNTRITANNGTAFGLQRGYGRDFDSNAALSGMVTWTTQEVAGSETDHSLPASGPNTYQVGTDRITSTGPNAYYYYDSENDIYKKYDETKTTMERDMRTDEQYKWTKQYEVTYDGTLGTADMQESTETVTVGYTEDRATTFSTTDVRYSYDNETILTDQEVADYIASGGSFENAFNSDTYSESSKTTSSTTSVDDGNLYHNQNFIAEGEADPSNYAFSFSHTLSHDKIVNSTGGQSNLGLSFSGSAKRVFTPVSKGNTVGEYDFNNIKVHAPEKKLIIQASPDSPIEEQIELKWSGLNLSIVGMAGTNTLTASAARAAIDQAKAGLAIISEERGIFGASQNRCEHAYKNVANTRENTQASESIIRDTDMAKEYMKFSNHSILEQAGQAMLAQANQSKQGVLNLLQ